MSSNISKKRVKKKPFNIFHFMSFIKTAFYVERPDYFWMAFFGLTKPPILMKLLDFSCFWEVLQWFYANFLPKFIRNQLKKKKQKIWPRQTSNILGWSAREIQKKQFFYETWMFLVSIQQGTLHSLFNVKLQKCQFSLQNFCKKSFISCQVPNYSQVNARFFEWNNLEKVKK